MPGPDQTASLEEQIAHWRSYLRHRQAIHPVDVAELEDHLREQVAVLEDAGLTTDEAFLVAVKRMGDLDALSREFAREHSDRLWKQLVVVPADAGEPRDAGAHRCRRRVRPRGGCGRRHQGPNALRDGPGRGRRLLRPQPEPLRAAPADRLLRLEAAARRAHHPLAGRGVRSGGRVRQRLSLRRGRLHRDAHGAAPADRALAGGRHRVRGRPLETGRRPHGLHPLLRRAGHLLRPDRARRRRPDRLHRADLPGDRGRRRALLRVVAAAVRSGRGGRDRVLAGRGQAERHREHGARADAPLHAALRRRA